MKRSILPALAPLTTFVRAPGLVGLLAACVLLAAGPAQAVSYKLKFGHATSDDSPQQLAAQKFAALVKERTKGEVEITVYASSTLGTDQQMINLTRGGSVDGVISGSTNFNGMVAQTAALELPFIFRDSAHAYKVLDGKIGQGILDEFGKHNLVGLAYFENGWREMTNNRRPILTPDDAKGLKIRTTPNPYHLKAFQLLGTNPSPLAIAELYSALEMRAFDAQEHPLPVFWTSKFYEVQKFLSLTNHAYSPSIAVMNKTRFDALPPEFQKVLIDSAHDAASFQRDLNARESGRIVGELRKMGVQVVEKPDMTAFRSLVYGPVRQAYAEKNGVELLDAMEAEK